MGLNDDLLQMHFMQKFIRYLGLKSTFPVEVEKAFQVGEDNRVPPHSLG
jgi:hypothetical protein